MRLQENAECVEANFCDAELGHIKRTERLMIVANKMLESPDASLPQQNSDWSDLKAAYRLCDRKEVTFDAVASCHWDRTRQTQPGRYLLMSDTTDIDHYSHNKCCFPSFVKNLNFGTEFALTSRLVNFTPNILSCTDS